MTASDLLPNDPGELRALLLAERARHAAELSAARSRAEEEIARLRQIIQELQRHRFGRRAERLDPDQLTLALEDLEQTLAAREAEPAGSAASKPAPSPARRTVNRGNLPADLPREEILIDVADKTCRCCGGALHPIGKDVSQRLDLVPARLRVLVPRRPKVPLRRAPPCDRSRKLNHRVCPYGYPYGSPYGYPARRGDYGNGAAAAVQR